FENRVTARRADVRRGGRRGEGRAARAARLGVSSVLGGQALALHVAPELLRHLGGSDRRGAEQRLQAVRATPEADRVASECGLLAGRALRHLLPLYRKLSRFNLMTTTCGGQGQRKRRRLGPVKGWTSPGSCRRVGREEGSTWAISTERAC